MRNHRLRIRTSHYAQFRMIALFVVLCGTCMLLLPSRAFAMNLHPEVAASLEDLTVQDRRLLDATARLTDVAECVRGTCPPLAAVDPNWKVSLARIAAHLAGIGGWQAAALAQLVPSELLAAVAKNARRPNLLLHAARIVRAVAAAGKNSECHTIHDNLVAYAAAKRSSVELFPAPGGSNFVGADRKCLAEIFPSPLFDVNTVATELDGYRLFAVAVPTATADTLYITLLGEVPELIHVEAHADIGDSRVYLVAIPENARVTTRVSFLTHNQMPPTGDTGAHPPLPEVRTRSVSTSEGYAGYERPSSCIDWTIAGANNSTYVVLYDGNVLAEGASVRGPHPMAGTSLVRRTYELEEVREHLLAVVDTATPAKVVASRRITADSLPATGCYEAKFDLRAAKDVALVDIVADQSCIASGVDTQRVRGRVERFLRDSKRSLGDAKGWAETTSSFAALSAQLDSFHEAEVGASRGRLSTRALVGGGATELARQGFKEALWVHVTCAQSEQRWELAIRVTLLDVARLVQPRDEVGGLDVHDVLRSQLEIASAATALDDAFVAALSRVFRERYVHFQAATSKVSFHSRISERIRVYVPPDTEAVEETPHDDTVEDYILEVDARRFSDEEEAFHICSTLESRQRLRSAERVDAWWKSKQRGEADYASTVVRPRAGEEAAYELVWAPRAPGFYLVRGQLTRERDDALDGEAATYHCVEVNDSRVRFTFDASYAVKTPVTIGASSLAGDVRYVQFMATFLRALNTSGGGPYVGIALGYADAIHTRLRPPSWDLVGKNGQNSASYDANGFLTLSWTRQSAQIGPAIAYYVTAPICAIQRVPCGRAARALNLLARFVPVVDIGAVDDSSIPSLPAFTKDARGLNLKISTFLQGGAHAQIDPEKSVYVLANIGLLSWSDYLLGGRDQRAAQSTITYDANITFGITVGAEYDL